MFETGLPGRLRRRNPRLSGTLRIRDALGHDVTLPLRGRASVFTSGGTGLTGHGEVWAVHTDPDATVTSLMISYGHTPAAEDRESGLCAAGDTVTLGGASFTWHCPSVAPRPAPSTVDVPRPRSGGTSPEEIKPAEARPGEIRPGWTENGGTKSGGTKHGTTEADETGTVAGAGSAGTRAPGNSGPSASRDPGPIRNARMPQPRSANARPATPNLRQRVQAIVRDLTHPPRH
ncbi:hypothetical protein Acy02nite_08390 [Actinoplanes cyaneus]|uniref:Uncharacterized protein n=1 Tax=Actinoplanes cyaneus TaxID=52696 RepID=A0A919IC96_9ACTN|nr:hypothetical protein [Actinoplanes cyaneus]GID62958.1 hypothetical protein Acy02nite_08390 [Actinoplanes cyaneus]